MKMIKLYAPLLYWNSPAYIRADICNGCGSKGLGGWIVPNTLYGLDISEACNIHDWMYDAGDSISDKESADRTFLNNMLRIIEGQTGWIHRLLQPLRRYRAMTYYTAIREFGGPAFWEKKNEPAHI